jgi:hypothetical protein
MKTKHLSSLLATFFLFVLISCQKEGSNNTESEVETTFKLSEDQAVSEAIGDDIDAVFIETSYSEGLMFRGSQQNPSNCASVNITGSGWPKTITIDFGTGCTGPDGIHRKGKIIVVLSDTVSQTGATAAMTFDGYHVQGFKVEGSITWTNTTTPNGFSWTREINDGKITTPGGNYYWLHEGIKYVTQTAGSGTPLNVLDDVYSITGEHTVTNPAGRSRTATVTEALEKKVICHNVSKGKIKIQGPNHFAIVDFGDGTCDKVATISIDGNPPRTFLLP